MNKHETISTIYITLMATLLFILIGIWIFCYNLPNIYPTCGEVVEVDYENDLVVVEDFNGNLWEFEGCEDWLEGDIASMIMNDCRTPEIYDDEIITVRYSGYAEN